MKTQNELIFAALELRTVIFIFKIRACALAPRLVCALLPVLFKDQAVGMILNYHLIQKGLTLQLTILQAFLALLVESYPQAVLTSSLFLCTIIFFLPPASVNIPLPLATCFEHGTLFYR